MAEHWLFFYPCGCPFSVMAAEVWPSDGSAWAEAFETPGRIQLARDHGVTVKKITHQEWQDKYADEFRLKCTHRPDPDPLSRTGVDDMDLDQLLIDHQVETQIDAYWTGIHALLDDEASDLWQAFGDVVDKLRPDLPPWDRREAIASIVTEFKQVVEDVD